MLIISYVYIFHEDLVCKQPLFQGGAKRVREKKGERRDSRVHRTARWTPSAPINCVTVSSPSVFRPSYALQTFNISISSCAVYQAVPNYPQLSSIKHKLALFRFTKPLVRPSPVIARSDQFLIAIKSSFSKYIKCYLTPCV